MRASALQVGPAARLLQRGAVLAYPTEAVWGLGCDPDNAEAVTHLLRMKGRSVEKGLILVAADIAQFAPYLEGLSPALRQRLLQSWPGPFTWLVPDNGRAAPWVRGQHDSVALRVSAHPLVVQLCRAFGGPLVSTSANRSGCAPVKWAWQLRRQFGSMLDGRVAGSLGRATRPSEIRDLRSGQIVRAGS